MGSTVSLSADPSLNQTEKVLVYGMPYQFAEFSAWTASSYANQQWVSPVQVGLFARSSAADRDYVPELASALPTVSASKLNFTVTLKSGLKFQSGGALTADDVVFSYKVALAPAIDNVAYATPAQFLTNDSVVKIDDSTVRFDLNDVFAFPLGLLSVSIIEKAVYGAQYDSCVAGVLTDCIFNDDDGFHAQGAGAYMVDDIDLTNMVITLVKNPNYWNAAQVNADKIVFTNINGIEAAKSALAAGEIDIMDSQYFPSVTELNSIPRINQQFVGSPVTQYMDINHDSPYWGKGNSTPNAIADGFGGTNNKTYALEVRKAFDYLVDREFAANELLDGQGQPANNPVPAAVLGWDSTLPFTPFNITIAKQHMEAAGYDYTTLTNSSQDAAGNAIYDGGAFPFFSLSLLNPDTSVARITWAANLVLNWQKLVYNLTEF
jgi:ABC-type transport system substrate-binding protein